MLPVSVGKLPKKGGNVKHISTLLHFQTHFLGDFFFGVGGPERLFLTFLSS